jgi:regulator of cell morphogenesis and NO signaling
METTLKGENMSMQSITDYFEKDHDRLDKLFKKFQELKGSDFESAKNNFREFKFGLQRHIVWEEDILFPLFERKTGIVDQGPTVVMRMEHRQIGASLEAIHQKVKDGKLPDDTEETALLSILQRHNIKEENVLYPGIDKLLSAEERQTVFERMKEIPEERYQHCCAAVGD